jgi:hypothetical protein
LGDEEKIRGKDKYIFGKSHFAGRDFGEKKIREQKETSRTGKQRKRI